MWRPHIFFKNKVSPSNEGFGIMLGSGVVTIRRLVAMYFLFKIVCILRNGIRDFVIAEFCLFGILLSRDFRRPTYIIYRPTCLFGIKKVTMFNLIVIKRVYLSECMSLFVYVP